MFDNAANNIILKGDKMKAMRLMRSVGAAKSVPSVKNIPEITGREKPKDDDAKIEEYVKKVFHETEALRPMFVSDDAPRKMENYSKASVSALQVARRKIAGIVIEGKNKVADGKYPDWKNKDEVYNWELCKLAVKEAIPPNGENHFFMLGSEDGGMTPRPKKENEPWDNWPYANKPTNVFGPFRNLYTKKIPDGILYIFFYSKPLQ